MLLNVTSCKHCVCVFVRGWGGWLCDRARDCHLVRNNNQTHVPCREVSLYLWVATEIWTKTSSLSSVMKMEAVELFNGGNSLPDNTAS